MSNSIEKQAPRRHRSATVAIVIVAIMCMLAFIAYTTLMRRPDIDTDVRIYVPSGATKEAVRDTLGVHLGQAYAWRVMTLWEMQGCDPATAHGSYVVSPSTTAIRLSRRLKYGRQSAVRVTFNNLRTMEQLSRKVSDNLEMGPDDFMQGCLVVLHDVSPANYIAHFVPDTYEFYWTASPKTVVHTLAATRDKFWNDERQGKAHALGLTPEQAATLASIVEEETAKTDEMPSVARLYLNRLDKGMKLQADPTVKFAVGDFSLRRILNKHLLVDSPYNTYRYAGLPPGPVRLATRQGIDAVLNAPEHTYLYMCAKEDFSGYHNFASTYDQHLANAKRYQRQLDKKGIK